MPRLAPVTRAVRPASFMRLLLRPRGFDRSDVVTLEGWGKSVRATTCMAPTVVAVQPAPRDRHHDEAAAPLVCLPLACKLGSHGLVRGFLDGAVSSTAAMSALFAAPTLPAT